MTIAFDTTLIEALSGARHVMVLTGAGVSAESGIPTFRDRLTGLWEQYQAIELATPQAFERDPALVWGWYEWRRACVRRAEPNPAHRAIVRLGACVPRLTLVTQNVDDLHERAGSAGVIHLHGELAQACCERCRAPHAAAAPNADLPEGGRRIEPPRCRGCGGRVRPAVVWFGEALPRRLWEAALAAARDCDLFFCIGTSAVVQPAASLIGMARHAGATTVQVNPHPTAADREMSHALRGMAGVVLPQLVAAACGG
ncbi:MAG: NAD-dependent deacylase [Gammaproteobacteria bacterium]|nr:NAD-dependent deacylase [Gammaproteobacteria bacterium]